MRAPGTCAKSVGLVTVLRRECLRFLCLGGTESDSAAKTYEMHSLLGVGAQLRHRSHGSKPGVD